MLPMMALLTIADISHYATTGGGGLLFGQFWPFLAIFSQIYALFGAPFPGLSSAMVLQNLSGMPLLVLNC